MAKKRVHISEGDVALLLKRYNLNTLLTVLEEISRHQSQRFNWDVLARTSKSGIKSPREFQALWRHLAYRHELCENVGEDARPLDDESDLEVELEPFPAISAEYSAEVADYVKELSSSKTALLRKHVNDANWDSNGQNVGSTHITSGSGTKALPQDLAFDSLHKGSAVSQSERKKRKLWTPEEDQELITAIEKFGEGNWANIVRIAFKHDRTASQLSQRWSLIRKRREGTGGGSLTPSSKPPGPGVSNGSVIDTQQSKGILASKVGIQKRVQPGPRISPLPSQVKQVGTKTATTSGSWLGSPNAGVTTASDTQAPCPTTSVPAKHSTSLPRNTSVPAGGRGCTKHNLGPDPMVQAAAVAAGARIAPASAAASLLKATQSGNVVHIGPDGVPLPKTTAVSTIGTPSSARHSSSTAGSRASPAVVHYIRTGSVVAPAMISAGGQRPGQPKTSSGKASTKANVITKNTALPCLAVKAGSRAHGTAKVSNPVSESSTPTDVIDPLFSSERSSETKLNVLPCSLARECDGMEDLFKSGAGDTLGQSSLPPAYTGTVTLSCSFSEAVCQENFRSTSPPEFSSEG